MRNAGVNDIFRAADIDIVKLLSRAAGDGNDSRTVYHTTLPIRAFKEGIERGRVADISRAYADSIRQVCGERVALHDQRVNVRRFCEKPTGDRSAEKACRSRNKVFCIHFLPSLFKISVAYLSHL